MSVWQIYAYIIIKNFTLVEIPDHAPEAVEEIEVQDVEDFMFARMKSLIFCEENGKNLNLINMLIKD